MLCLKGTIQAYRPRFSFLSDQIVEQKQLPALCILLSFWGIRGGRIGVGDAVKDAAKTIRSPLKETRANCQHPKQQPGFRKLKYLTRLDLEPFSADI